MQHKIIPGMKKGFWNYTSPAHVVVGTSLLLFTLNFTLLKSLRWLLGAKSDSFTDTTSSEVCSIDLSIEHLCIWYW